MIRSFRDKITEAVFDGESPKGFPSDLVKVARRELRYLHAAGELGDLRSPPGNRLAALAGIRQGQHAIRINDQFRVCFVWTADTALRLAKALDTTAQLWLNLQTDYDVQIAKRNLGKILDRIETVNKRSAA
jgi:proteic killer suppression protein